MRGRENVVTVDFKFLLEKLVNQNHPPPETFPGQGSN